jgi:hypothetical protein
VFLSRFFFANSSLRNYFHDGSFSGISRLKFLIGKHSCSMQAATRTCEFLIGVLIESTRTKLMEKLHHISGVDSFLLWGGSTYFCIKFLVFNVVSYL